MCTPPLAISANLVPLLNVFAMLIFSRFTALAFAAWQQSPAAIRLAIVKDIRVCYTMNNSNA